jgi:hypothetical protein
LDTPTWEIDVDVTGWWQWQLGRRDVPQGG